LFSPTRREVQERLRVALGQADAGVRPVDGRLTTGAFLDQWITTSVRPRLRPTTADSYAWIVDRYIAPSVGKVPLAKLGPEHVQTMLASLTARGDLSPTTVRYSYTVLRIALGRALKAGYVLRNVATLVDPPAKARHDLAPLTVDQAQVFLHDTSNDRLAALYITAIALGLRKGELLALRWDDVDLEAGSIAIRNTLQRTGLAPTKTERSRRTLVLPAMVAAALRDHRRRQREERLSAGQAWQDQGYVFTSRIGTALDGRNVTRAFHAALERAGLPRQRFHDMRHACATLLLERGEELAVVSRLLGHANLSTTADVYAHLTRGMQQRAADRMDEILHRSTGA
jgi:integrase